MHGKGKDQHGKRGDDVQGDAAVVSFTVSVTDGDGALVTQTYRVTLTGADESAAQFLVDPDGEHCAAALRTLARHLVASGHHHLTIDPAVENERAIACYRKIGFRPVGVLRRNERGADGTFHDALLMDLLADELR